MVNGRIGYEHVFGKLRGILNGDYDSELDRVNDVVDALQKDRTFRQHLGEMEDSALYHLDGPELVEFLCGKSPNRKITRKAYLELSDRCDGDVARVAELLERDPEQVYEDMRSVGIPVFISELANNPELVVSIYTAKPNAVTNMPKEELAHKLVRSSFIELLKRNDGNVIETARQLGYIDRLGHNGGATFATFLRRLGIKKKDYI